MRGSWVAVGLFGVLLLSGGRAHADGKNCAEDAEAGQQLRASGRLRAARDRLLACGADACPALVRQDCAQWANEVLVTMPTIVIDARDARGHDIEDVVVRLDGEVIAARLDGKAIPVDSGPRLLEVEHAGQKRTEKVILKENVKGRVFTFTFDRTARPEPAQPPPPPPPQQDSPSPAGERHHTAAPWVVVALGGATLIAGGVLFLAAPKLPPNCSASRNSCVPVDADGFVIDLPADPAKDTPEQARERAAFADARKQSATHIGMTTAGTIMAIGGLGLVAGGLVWHFLEPTGTRAAWAAPYLNASGAGFAAGARF